MPHCDLAKQCVFFTVRDEGVEMREYLAGVYCTENFGDCARYRAALEMGQELVPDDIFPNENDFVSLFAWSANRGESPARKSCRSRHPEKRAVSRLEKPAAPSSHLPATRQTRSQH